MLWKSVGQHREGAAALSWDEDLFSVLEDLEGQAEALHAAARDPDLADRSRAEYAAVTLLSRVLACDRLGVDVLGVGRLDGLVRRVGRDWCLLAARGAEWVVPLAAVTGVHDAGPRSLPEVAWSPTARLGLGSALRRIAASGDRCLLHQVDGQTREVTLGRVGADFVEAAWPGGQVVLTPFAAVAAVQRRPDGE